MLSPIEEKIAKALNKNSSVKKMNTMPTRIGEGSNTRSQVMLTNRTSIMESSTKNANIECPHCGRKFNEKAASRHIAYCREKAILNAYKAGKGTQI